mmetsp:Transcript_97102/g.246909  ORF Transcript_97102/g.246909 Transcript_97102/m.246909 type:complete len:163 (+) Transcript_97102:91-579(+)
MRSVRLARACAAHLRPLSAPVALASRSLVTPAAAAPVAETRGRGGLGALGLLRVAGFSTSSKEELRAVISSGKACIVDLRGDSERATQPVVVGAVHCEWVMENSSMRLDGLPEDKAIPIVLHCLGGVRATKAKAYLEKQGYTTVLNGGGPKTPELFEEYSGC